MQRFKMIRYSDVIPLTLYRLQGSPKTILRERQFQANKGSPAFDFVKKDSGIYGPVDGDYFKIPNGLSLRPIGVSLMEIYSHFNNPIIYEIK